MTALAVDDGPALRSMISAMELLGPVRQATQSLALPASGDVLDGLTTLLDVLSELESSGEPRQPRAGPAVIPVSDGATRGRRSQASRGHVCSMFARMSRYHPAATGTS